MRVALAFALASTLFREPALLAVVLETSRSIYSFESPGAERFRNLPDPELVIPLPASFDSAAPDQIRCQLTAQRNGDGVRRARARLTLELYLMDIDAETYQVLAIGKKKLKTDADGFDTEFFDFPTELLPDSPSPANVAVRGQFNLDGGKKADQVSARCSLTGEKRLVRRRTAPAPSSRLGVGFESTSGTSSFLLEPARKLKNVPNPLQLAAVPRTADDTLEIACDAFTNDRRGEPIEGARWTLLVEQLVLDHASRTFEVTPVAVESQETDDLGRAFSGHLLPSERFGEGLESGTQTAWIQAELDLTSSEKAGEVSSTCLVIRR